MIHKSMECGLCFRPCVLDHHPYFVLKIIQSYWSKPAGPRPFESSGGWPAPRYQWMSWAFSCLQLKKYHDHVELITDKNGKNLLINELQLPYDSVSTVLDDISDYPSSLWALGKVYSYQKQLQPFLHFDNDVFVWGKLSDKVYQSDLIVQSIEFDSPSLQEVVDNLNGPYSFLPVACKQIIIATGSVPSYNLGMVGGSNTNFFHDYTSEVFEFINNNLSSFRECHFPVLNVIYEQFFLLCLSEIWGKRATCFLNRAYLQTIYDKLDIHRIIAENKYFHVHHLKKNVFVCELLEKWLKEEYPEYYHRISQRFAMSE